MRIGIDIDGVLFPWAEAANEALMAMFGIADPGPHTSWEYLRNRVTRRQWDWLWTEHGQTIVFSQVDRTYPGVVAAFNRIIRNPRHRIHFVTHRDPRRTAVHTSRFLSRNFGGHPWAGVHVLQNGTPKHSLMDWDVFIDDKPDTVHNMLDYTVAQVFAPVRPWNTELGAFGHVRLTGYDDPQVLADVIAGL